MLQQTMVLGFVLVACTGEVQETDTDTGADTLEIVGTYTSNFGATVEISETEVSISYGTPSLYAVVDFDNAERFIVAQNDSNNASFPDLWSRFDWAVDGTTVFWCQQVFDGATRADAENAPSADRTDPASGGCGTKGFAFTQLTPSAP